MAFRNKPSPFDCIIFGKYIIFSYFLQFTNSFNIIFSNSIVYQTDLDDTLYPSNTGIGAAVKKNIDLFLMEKCGFSQSKASTLRVELFKSHGSTLAGLRALGYDITAEEYHG